MEISKNSSWLSFSDNGRPKIKHVILAEEIASEVKLFKNNKHYKYFDSNLGIWRDNAHQYLQTYIVNKLGKYSNKSIVKEVLFHLENKYHNNEHFDPFENSNPFLIAIQNGTYNLQTNNFTPSYNSNDYIQTKHINIVFDPNSECPQIEKFLMQVVGKEHLDFIYEWFGFQLVRAYWPQCFLLINGVGGAGKSKLIELLTIFVGGDNVSSVSLETLMNDKFSIAELHTKSSNLCADIDPKYMDKPGLLKNLTGDDLVTANRKYLNPITFKNYAKITFSMNSLPTLTDTSDGMKRRTLILPITNKIKLEKQKADIINDLNNKEEISGLFNRAIEGIKRLNKNKWFSTTSQMESAVNNWFEESDIIQQFLIEKCECDLENNSLYTKGDDLFYYFNNYRSNSKIDKISKIKFYKELSNKGYYKKKKKLTDGTSFQAIFGVRLKY
ncbi:DNA primase family protein [Rossellomorea aquimaris]|uniref:DNA primase family protein n=1 Tax=Rossellomorea aquimaris TaxID=189382 RepID=UPI0005CA5973|nr:DNA primase family protein [Rossellomorea aquimaris]